MHNDVSGYIQYQFKDISQTALVRACTYS